MKRNKYDLKQLGDVIKQVEELVSVSRAKAHGDASETHDCVACIVNVLLRKKLSDLLNAEDIYVILIALKLVRDSQNPDNIDNAIDTSGYSVLWTQEKAKRGGL